MSVLNFLCIFCFFPFCVPLFNFTTTRDAVWAPIPCTGFVRPRSSVGTLCTSDTAYFVGGQSDSGAPLDEVVTIDMQIPTCHVSRSSYVRQGMATTQTSGGWVLFGGMSGSLTLENDLWLVSVVRDANNNSKSLRFTQLANSSNPTPQANGLDDWPTARQDAGIAVLNDTLYLLGGINGAGACGLMWKTSFPWGEAWDIVDSSYDIEPRFGHALLTDENTILVFGGRDEMEQFLPMPSLRYDANSRVWRATPTVNGPGPRAYFSSARMADHFVSRWVFFFGGMSSTGLHNDLFVLDVKSERWLELLPILPTLLSPRSASGLCVATTREDLDDLSLVSFAGSADFQKLNDSWANNFRLCSQGSQLQLSDNESTKFFTDGSDGVAALQQKGHSFPHPGNRVCSWRVQRSSSSKDLRIQVTVLFLADGDHLRVSSTPCDDDVPPVSNDELITEFQTREQELVTRGCVWVTFSTAPNATSYSYFNITCSEFARPPERSTYLWILLGLGILIAILAMIHFIKRRRRSRNCFAVMVSYSHKDVAFAGRLQEALEAGGLQVWIDNKCIQPGEDWREHIAHAIEESFAVIFIVSEHSVQSRYCKEEVCYAKKKEKYILPLIWQEVPDKLWKRGLRSKLPPQPWRNFAHDEDSQLKLLVADLQQRHHSYTVAMAATRAATHRRPAWSWGSIVGALRGQRPGPPPLEDATPNDLAEPQKSPQGKWNVFISYEPGTSKCPQGLRMALSIWKRLQQHGVTCVLAVRDSIPDAYRLSQGISLRQQEERIKLINENVGQWIDFEDVEDCTASLHRLPEQKDERITATTTSTSNKSTDTLFTHFASLLPHTKNSHPKPADSHERRRAPSLFQFRGLPAVLSNNARGSHSTLDSDRSRNELPPLDEHERFMNTPPHTNRRLGSPPTLSSSSPAPPIVATAASSTSTTAATINTTTASTTTGPKTPPSNGRQMDLNGHQIDANEYCQTDTVVAIHTDATPLRRRSSECTTKTQLCFHTYHSKSADEAFLLAQTNNKRRNSATRVLEVSDEEAPDEHKPKKSPWTYFNFGRPESKKERSPSPHGSPPFLARVNGRKSTMMPRLSLDEVPPMKENSGSHRSSTCEASPTKRLSLHRRKSSASARRPSPPDKVATTTIEHNMHLIEQCQLVIFMETADSVGDKSECLRELQLAVTTHKKIIRVKLRKEFELTADFRTELTGADLLDFTSEKCKSQSEEWKWLHMVGVVFQALSEAPGERKETKRDDSWT